MNNLDEIHVMIVVNGLTETVKKTFYFINFGTTHM